MHKGGSINSIAIIPARGGSKRIPRKNIKLFNNKPIISYPISTAIDSGIFSAVYVSTEDIEIAEIAKRYGAIVPFIRRKDLSDDTTPTLPVIQEFIMQLEEIKINPQYVCCIYPCTPLLKTNHLHKCFNKLIELDAKYCYPIIEYPHPIQRSIRINEIDQPEFLFPSEELKRTQDFEKRYHDAGQFYWGKTSAWKKGDKMHTSGVAKIFPRNIFVDIDNNDEWKLAESLHKIQIEE